MFLKNSLTNIKLVLSYYKKKNNQEIGINEFCEIASQEEVITERELFNAFRSIDTNENGYISYREFMDAFTTVTYLLKTQNKFNLTRIFLKFPLKYQKNSQKI